MADMVKESIDVTAGLLALALVALPVGAVVYYDTLSGTTFDNAPSVFNTIADYIPVVLLAGIIFLAFSKFR